jgi:hypothetical protein
VSGSGWRKGLKAGDLEGAPRSVSWCVNELGRWVCVTLTKDISYEEGDR